MIYNNTGTRADKTHVKGQKRNTKKHFETKLCIRVVKTYIILKPFYFFNNNYFNCETYMG